jgi:hypothetical protein
MPEVLVDFARKLGKDYTNFIHNKYISKFGGLRLRTGQMILAQTLLYRLLGRGMREKIEG